MVDAGGPVRAVGVAPALLLAPGLAWTAFLDLRSAIAEILLAVMVSLAIETLVGVVLAAANIWSPGATAAATAAITAIGLAASAHTARSSAAPEDA